jgi:hypothetical protein
VTRRTDLSRRRPLPRGAWALVAVVAAGVFALRVWNIHRHFWMLGDQIRDWQIALGPFGDLPLVGPATHVGGYTIGPAFYWIIWAIRVTFGPWFDNLPHAGGIGQAALQAAADALLLVALWRRFESPWAAAAAVILIATAAFDLCLAPLVWNPVVGSTLAKAAIALVLLDYHRRNVWRSIVLVAVAWSAVHAYTGAIFVTVSILALVVLDPLVRSDRRLLRRNAAVALIVIGLLQLPYVAHQVREQFAAPAMGAVTGSVAEVILGRRGPEIAKSVDGYVGAVQFIQVAPWRVTHLPWILLACAAVVAVRWRRDGAVLAVVVLPPLLAVAGYSLFLAELDHYYYLSLMPSAVLAVILALSAWPRPRGFVVVVGVPLVIASLLVVPARVRLSLTMHRMPEYGALVQGSRTVAARRQPMRAILTDFALPPTADPSFPYRILGGTLDPSSRWTALIAVDGSVRYRQASGD